MNKWVLTVSRRFSLIKEKKVARKRVSDLLMINGETVRKTVLALTH